MTEPSRDDELIRHDAGEIRAALVFISAPAPWRRGIIALVRSRPRSSRVREVRGHAAETQAQAIACKLRTTTICDQLRFWQRARERPRLPPQIGVNLLGRPRSPVGLLYDSLVAHCGNRGSSRIPSRVDDRGVDRDLLHLLLIGWTIDVGAASRSGVIGSPSRTAHKSRSLKSAFAWEPAEYRIAILIGAIGSALRSLDAHV